MERTIEGSCSRLQEPELPHGFWCSPSASTKSRRALAAQAIIVFIPLPLLALLGPTWMTAQRFFKDLLQTQTR
jgi:hypothetical protein